VSVQSLGVSFASRSVHRDLGQYEDSEYGLDIAGIEIGFAAGPIIFFGGGGSQLPDRLWDSPILPFIAYRITCLGSTAAVPFREACCCSVPCSVEVKKAVSCASTPYCLALASL